MIIMSSIRWERRILVESSVEHTHWFPTLYSGEWANAISNRMEYILLSENPVGGAHVPTTREHLTGKKSHIFRDKEIWRVTSWWTRNSISQMILREKAAGVSSREIIFQAPWTHYRPQTAGWGEPANWREHILLSLQFLSTGICSKLWLKTSRLIQRSTSYKLSSPWSMRWDLSKIV